MSTQEQTTNEGGEDLAAVIAKLQAELASERAEKEKVNSKNRELVTEKQVAKQAADAAVLDAAEKSGDIEAMKAAHKREIDKLTTERDTLSTDLRTIRVDNEINRALAEGNVFEHNLEPLTYMFKAKAKYENGAGNIEGKAIGEYISEYLAGDVGSHYRRGSTNSGASATGNTNPMTPNAVWTKEDFIGKRAHEADLLARDKPAEYNALVAQLGLPDNFRLK